ncbi:hypothetical protein AVEN_272223-1 [Araneus ventricosus]|uniref:Uncharacterized protein n=1 Tax=Araneus ventricosus TaxID=182803 RepID=A0A4Y2SKR1_ARAVE|nr:hypothetical protein AVEN_272223-1 [Araneus ventricosus]
MAKAMQHTMRLVKVQHRMAKRLHHRMARRCTMGWSGTTLGMAKVHHWVIKGTPLGDQRRAPLESGTYRMAAKVHPWNGQGYTIEIDSGTQSWSRYTIEWPRYTIG